MANVMEVITGIQQAIHAKHEGGTEFGLKRESENLLQGVSIYDPRIIDGFGVQFQGNNLLLKYHCEMPLTAVHDKNFETDVRKTVKDIISHIKTEYKKVTKSQLSLLEQGDINIMVQSANRRTCYVNAVQTYKIENMDMPKEKINKKQVDSQRDHYAEMAKGWLMNVRKK